MGKTVFRPGDKVKIVNPEFYLRRGFPLTKEAIREKFTLEDRSKIDELLNHFKLATLNDINWVNKVNKVKYKIEDAISYGILNRDNFGGREKKIYTEKLLDYEDCQAKVLSKRVVRTGVYVPGCLSGGYYDGPEYESPYLSNMKSHIILKIAILPNDNKNYLSIYNELEIESINVIKL